MRFKLSRLAALIDKYGAGNGMSLYLKLKFGKLSRIKVPGIKHPFTLRVRSSDSAVFDQVFIKNEYDIEIPFQPSVIIDAGANIGLFTILMKNRFSDSKIFCIEPSEENFGLLNSNLSHYNDITLICAGLWSSDSSLNVVDRYQMGYSALTVEEDNAKGKTLALSMDSLLDRYGIDTIDLLKIDIETSEIELFSKNYENWLPKTKMIVIELHDWMKPGCSETFFKAISKSMPHFSYSICGENTILINKLLHKP